jgi:hypothetical protein
MPDATERVILSHDCFAPNHHPTVFGLAATMSSYDHLPPELAEHQREIDQRMSLYDEDIHDFIRRAREELKRYLH